MARCQTTIRGDRMKIVKFEDFHVDCGWEIYSFLKISTDEGLTGWSEFKEHRRPGIGAAIQGMGEVADRPGPARDRPHRGCCSIPSRARSLAGLTPMRQARSSMPASTSSGKALGVPVYELFGGAVRDRMPVYWSRCGVIRARCADYFDGKVIDEPAVHTVDDLKAAAREARERGYKAIKTQPPGVRCERRPPVYAGLLARARLSRAQPAGGHARRAHRAAHRATRGRRPESCASRSMSTSTTRPKVSGASPRRSSRST